MDIEKKKFKEYQEATGGDSPLGYIVPFGLPAGVEERGGIIAVYDECIRKKVTWEDLLNFHPPEDAII
jgi:hypothetical protein